jgi:hypothetical protein
MAECDLTIRNPLGGPELRNALIGTLRESASSYLSNVFSYFLLALVSVAS